MSVAPIAAADASAADEIVARMDRVPFTRLHARTCGLIAFGNFLDAFDALILAAVVAVIVGSFHIAFAQAGLLFSAAYMGMLAGALGAGWLSEAIGRKPVIVWSVGGFGALSIAAAFAWDYDALLAIRIVQGLALGAAVPISSALYGECLSGVPRGPAFMLVPGVFFGLGIFVAPLAGLACIAAFGPALGWRALFILGGLAVPLAVAMQLLLPESPRWLAVKGRIKEASAVVASYEAKAEAEAEGKALPSPVLHAPADRKATRLAELFQGIYPPRTALAWIQFFAAYFMLYGLTAWLPTLYVRVGGLPASSALELSIIFGAVLLATSVIWGIYADHIGRRLGFALGYAICIIGFAFGVYAVAEMHMTNWQLLLAVSVVTVIGNNLCAGLCFVYTVELFPTRMRGWATSTGSAMSRVGSIIAPIAIGALLGADLGIGSVFGMLGLVAVAGLLATVALGPETSKGTLEKVSA